MRARDVMTTEVLTVSPGTSVTEVAKLLLEKRISGAPVVDEAGSLIGIICEGDLMRRAELGPGRRRQGEGSSAEKKAEAYVKAHGLTAGDVMTKEVVTINEHEPLDRIAMMFEERRIKRAPVVRDGKIVGIVSRANLLRGLAGSKVEETGPDDKEIRSAILVAAEQDAGVRTPLVGVTVSGGVVHLWGDVATDVEREAIRVVAETAEGVREVHNHIRVLPPSVLEWDFE